MWHSLLSWNGVWPWKELVCLGLFWFFFSYHISGVPVAFAQKYSIVLIKRSDSSCDTVNPGRSDSVGSRYIPWQRDRKVAFTNFSNNQDTIVVITTGSWCRQHGCHARNSNCASPSIKWRCDCKVKEAQLCHIIIKNVFNPGLNIR